MLMVEFSVTPLDKGESVGEFTAQAIDMISRSGLKYKVGSMGTTVEGDLSDVLALVAECLTSLSQKSGRLVFNLQGDLRRKGESHLQQAIDRVEEVLGQEVPQ